MNEPHKFKDEIIDWLNGGEYEGCHLKPPRREWVGLTEDEKNFLTEWMRREISPASHMPLHEFAKKYINAIEEKLKNLNT